MPGLRPAFFVLAGMLGIFNGALLPLSVSAQKTTGPARFLVEGDGDLFTVRALYRNSTADTTTLHYTFTVERTGASTSRTRQSGTFTPTPGRADTLSTVRVTAQPGDRLHLHLVVHRQEETLAEVTRTETISAPE